MEDLDDDGLWDEPSWMDLKKKRTGNFLPTSWMEKVTRVAATYLGHV